MKLINTDELMYEVNNIFLQYAEFNHWLARDMYNRMKLAVFTVKEVDAEPVIRCEKCIHHRGLNAMEKFEYGSNVVWCSIPHFGGVLMKNDAFCSFGEREGGE